MMRPAPAGKVLLHKVNEILTQCRQPFASALTASYRRRYPPAWPLVPRFFVGTTGKGSPCSFRSCSSAQQADAKPALRTREVSRFPVLGEWHGPADSVVPVWHDVHRTGDAALLADEAPTDHRPRLVLGQGVEHASIALTGRTLNVAGYMAVGEPFCRAAGWVLACPSRLSFLSHCG